MDIEKARRIVCKLLSGYDHLYNYVDILKYLDQSIDEFIQIREIHGIDIFEDTKLQFQVFYFSGELGSEFGTNIKAYITCLEYIWLNIIVTCDEQLISKVCAMGYKIPEEFLYHSYVLQDKYEDFDDFKSFIKSIETKCEINNSLGEISNDDRKRSKM